MGEREEGNTKRDWVMGIERGGLMERDKERDIGGEREREREREREMGGRKGERRVKEGGVVGEIRREKGT